MTKLRITEPGWTNFNGDFGGVQFTNNVSDRDLTEREMLSLSNCIRMETLEGDNPSSSQIALEAMTTPMGVERVLQAAVEEVPVVVHAPKYTRAQLEAIADADGISGLRKISSPLGLTSNSIRGLLDMIINFQGGEPVAGKVVPQALKGSSKLASHFEIDGKKVQLGSVVRAAFEQYEKTGKTTEDWNELPQEYREQLIDTQLASMLV